VARATIVSAPLECSGVPPRMRSIAARCGRADRGTGLMRWARGGCGRARDGRSAATRRSSGTQNVRRPATHPPLLDPLQHADATGN
jgi:hypothetical protein